MFDRAAYQTLRKAVIDHLQANGEITVADLRDRFATSRKYALALLEHFDKVRVTRRVGDVHVPGAAIGAAAAGRAGAPEAEEPPQ